MGTVQAIRARLAAIEPLLPFASRPVVSPDTPDDEIWEDVIAKGDGNCNVANDIERPEVATFFVSAPEDIRFLLAEVERLSAGLGLR